MSIRRLLRSRLEAALAGLAPDAEIPALAEMLVPSNPKHGDYQINCAMPLGKLLRRSSRDVATELVGRLNVADVAAPPEIAGPGFINIRLSEGVVIGRIAGDERLGIAPTGA